DGRAGRATDGAVAIDHGVLRGHSPSRALSAATSHPRHSVRIKGLTGRHRRFLRSKTTSGACG
ncbi:hypothetical protein N9247_00430, partial [bacterium]|nr:hypothetical protein [bacterium]